MSSKDASVVMVCLRFSMWSCCLTCPGSGSGMVHLRYPQVAGPAREGLWALFLSQRPQVWLHLLCGILSYCRAVQSFVSAWVS